MQRHVTHLSADLLVRRAFPRGVRRQSEGKYSQDGISSREIYWPITPFLFHFRAKTFVHGSNHGKQISATLRTALILFVLLSGQCKYRLWFSLPSINEFRKDIQTFHVTEVLVGNITRNCGIFTGLLY